MACDRCSNTPPIHSGLLQGVQGPQTQMLGFVQPDGACLPPDPAPDWACWRLSRLAHLFGRSISVHYNHRRVRAHAVMRVSPSLRPFASGLGLGGHSTATLSVVACRPPASCRHACGASGGNAAAAAAAVQMGSSSSSSSSRRAALSRRRGMLVVTASWPSLGRQPDQKRLFVFGLGYTGLGTSEFS